jgi:hypothetical protein
MKQVQKTRINILFILYFFALSIPVSAQDSTTAEPSLKLRYFVKNNSMQYFLVVSGIKEGKKFKPLPRQAIQLYLDSNKTENLISRTVTDEKGEAKIIIPPALKDKWKNSTQHNFIAVLETDSSKEAITSTLEITRAKIELDTSSADGERAIEVKVMFLENNEWVPAKDVEMKVGIARAGGILTAGEEETYTTDSTGTTTVPFKKDSLPGDQHGNFVLVAKVEDNDLYGNLLVEKIVPWGIAVKPEKNFFDQRTLWSTRFRTPWWLLFLAYSIVIAVWGTIIFLVLQIVKIKKLGAKAS